VPLLICPGLRWRSLQHSADLLVEFGGREKKKGKGRKRREAKGRERARKGRGREYNALKFCQLECFTCYLFCTM